MSRIRINPYKAGSQSARDLARSMNVLRLKKQGSRFRPRTSDVIINWGNAELPVYPCRVINPSTAVAKAADKIMTLMSLRDADIQHVPFTVDREEALGWFGDDDSISASVVCRTLTRANSGRGIVIASNASELVAAPLYTKYIKKKHEYRVHVAFGEVIDVQRKMRSREVADENVNWQVRNHSNGFIFGREGVSLPANATAQAVNAVTALGLDFGAVDLLWNEREDQYYVLEVNTAPGLAGSTLEKYTQVFNNL